MKLYHPTTEQEEAGIQARGFSDTVHMFGSDGKGRMSVRVAVGFSDRQPPQAIPGACWVVIDVPDDVAGCFEDSELVDDARLYYLPAQLANMYLRKQQQQ